MSRIIAASVRTSAVQVAECVQSIFALALLQPDSSFYLSAPELYNVIVLPNRLEQFAALFPEIETTALRLDDALIMLAARGVTVRVIHARGVNLADVLPATAAAGIARQGGRPLHQQGILTADLGLRGPLRFTAAGIDLGGESVELISDRTQLRRMALELDAYWEELN